MARESHPKPEGPMVEFYFGANSQYQRGEAIPVTVNGHKYRAIVGQRNTLPREVVKVLQNAQSRTQVVDRKAYDPAEGGKPRDQREFFAPKTTHVYQQDYDIEVIKVHE